MKNNLFSYSRFQANSLLELLRSHYALSPDANCSYYVLGLHDNYLLTDRQEKYICRIYRSDWRTEEDILFELDLLCFLEQQDCSVVAPIKNTSGENFIVLDAAEGKRYAALFPFANGYAPGKDLNSEQAALLGFNIAKLHQHGNKFVTQNQRQTLNLDYLLDKSILSIRSYLTESDNQFITCLAKKIRDNISDLPATKPYYTVCTGDVNASNFFINDDKEIRIFDFDQCGYGWRAFEIGKFNASISQYSNRQILLNAFIDGYQQHSRLNEVELQSIPYFTLISQLWVMAIHVYNVKMIGSKYLEADFWQRRITILKNEENKLKSL